MKLELVYYPNDILLKKCESVVKVTSDLVELAKEMYLLMKHHSGIGISANQVGHSIRLLVIENKGTPLYMFNPKLIQQSSKCELNEGCLSAPGKIYPIKRAKNVKVQYRDINNKVSYIELDGWEARALLHEIEHLEGKDFTKNG